MNDKIYEGFLQRQLEEGMALADESDLLDLTPLDGPVPQHYIAEFHCTGLVARRPGEVEEANLFHVGIYFPPDYLRRAEPAEVLTWLGPPTIFHPNIRCHNAIGIGFICIGRLMPGTGLVDLCYQVFEIITFNKVSMADALNASASAWARRNQCRFPVDRRPLRRRRQDIQVVEAR